MAKSKQWLTDIVRWRAIVERNVTHPLGMKSTPWRVAGEREQIYFALGYCLLGDILVAQSEKGICAIFFGHNPESLLRELQNAFPRVTLLAGGDELKQVLAQVVAFIETPQPTGLALPLDIRGTAFQQRVWQGLLTIPLGTTISYAELAQRTGATHAVRAVANACGANRLAVVIPCHRVVSRDGRLSGYRWGVERKRLLLQQERGEPAQPTVIV